VNWKDYTKPYSERWKECVDCGKTTRSWFDYFTVDEKEVRCKQCAIRWCKT
jgi:hypothetical protein